MNIGINRTTFLNQKSNYRMLTSLVLSGISVLAYLGLTDVISTGKQFLFLDGSTRLNVYMSLYIVLSAAQYVFMYAPTLFLRGWTRESVAAIATLFIVVASLSSMHDVNEDPMYYLQGEESRGGTMTRIKLISA